MNEQEAIAVLKNGIIMAQSKGIYTLGDSKFLKEAIDIVCPDTPKTEE